MAVGPGASSSQMVLTGAGEHFGADPIPAVLQQWRCSGAALKRDHPCSSMSPRWGRGVRAQLSQHPRVHLFPKYCGLETCRVTPPDTWMCGKWEQGGVSTLTTPGPSPLSHLANTTVPLTPAPSPMLGHLWGQECQLQWHKGWEQKGSVTGAHKRQEAAPGP